MNAVLVLDFFSHQVIQNLSQTLLTLFKCCVIFDGTNTSQFIQLTLY